VPDRQYQNIAQRSAHRERDVRALDLLESGRIGFDQVIADRDFGRDVFAGDIRFQFTSLSRQQVDGVKTRHLEYLNNEKPPK
jgi:hypothetical protein